ncbi:prolyl oligopeptidase family serine peptidase [Rhodoplanes serenus]|uniref:Prolyl oligopeptidase family serine peptidase n=1 Tax=Rhodoplanes serenus TaxID=200615 RepID=A0A9X4XN10_9BRAD|nr:S9 family peptidase [Rhodoplanes serenus]MTW17091.1 prolyl oligopeptidase family serine peptidase [Rhodoplanes serenus]
MLDRVPRPPVPPRVTEQQPAVTVRHGVTLVDEFAWLRDPNWQAVMRDPAVLDPAIRAVLETENAYADAVMAPTAALQETLFAEMKGRIKEDDAGVPAPDGPWAYYARHRVGGEHPLICRTPRHGGDEQILLDGDALADGKAFFQIGPATHSPDHRLLAWSADDRGSEFFTTRLRDLATGQDLADIVPEVSGGVVWTSDSTAFYYVRLDERHRPTKVFRHVVGTAAETDEEIFRTDDPGFFVSLSRLQSGRFAEISVHDHESAEAWLLDLATPAAPTLVAPRETSLRYEIEHHPDLGGEPVLVIRTNADDAEDFKIVTAPLATPGRAHWRDLVPHRPGVFVLGYGVTADWLIRLERSESLPRIVVRRLATGEEHTIAFDEEAYSLGIDPGYEFATDTLRFNYSSMTTPTEVWDYDCATRARVLRKRQEVPSGHDPAAYVTRRLFAPAPDGETVPVSLLARRDTPLDGTAPALVYGYGAYGMSIPAAFSTARLSLVDRGFVYAIVHARGGTEKGWRWYREGKLAFKPNTFRDVIAATEHLVAARIVAPDRIVAHGGSAGGMLIGALANLRPDLYAGLIAEVPFVDVLNTMLDETLPLTPPEWLEWGDPIRDEAAFHTIRAYSPYDNVRAQAYPAILALAGLTDPRVTYWEPAKWVARLRRLKIDDNPLLLRTNLDAGHGGAAGRFERLREVALAYAFALAVVDRA